MTLIGGVVLVGAAGLLLVLAAGLVFYGLRSAQRLYRRGAAQLDTRDLPVVLAATLPWLAVSVFCGLAAWRLLTMAAAAAG